MHPYVRSLKLLFEQNANPANAVPMKKYMRDQFEYLGIKSPQFKKLLSEFIGQNGLPPIKDLDVIARELWSLPQREFQYLATSLIGKMEKQLGEECHRHARASHHAQILVGHSRYDLRP